MVKWSRLSKEVLDEAEKGLMDMAGVPIESRYIPANDQETKLAFCLVCGEESLPPLVLLHGFLGTSIIFFKMLEPLCREYRVFCIDLMGMGRSSRPFFTSVTCEEAEEFFVEPIERCRENLGIETMVLAGHSFGGYIAGCYVEKYPQNVTKLVMLSPIGVPRAPPDYNIYDRIKQMPWYARPLGKLMIYFWNKNTTMAGFLRQVGPLSGRLVKWYVKRRMTTLTEEESQLLVKYLEQVNLYPGSGEYGLTKVLKLGGWAQKPLCERLTNIPVVFMYGDRDWMDPEGAAQNVEVNECKVIVEHVSNSGHHLYIENPQELCSKLLNALKQLDQPKAALA